ncbi:MAG: PINc/VapC family ATPase [Halobacteriaceae archaeon]
MQVVPDTGAVVDGRVSERVEDGSYADATVVVPEAVLAELERQANAGRETGQDGLAELERLVGLADTGEIDLEYAGRRPTEAEVEGADAGAVDAMIRDLAADRGARLLTTDGVQRDAASARGVEVEFVEPRSRDVEHLAVEDYFDEATMSVHLKTGAPPMAKRGEIGEMAYQQLDDDALDEETLREYAREVVAAAESSPDGFVEVDEPGMQIVQYGQYRIAVARPPFADGWEITAVRPVARTDMDSYDHADELRDRLRERQRGVLVAGAPGAGKTTFAQAAAEFLVDSDFSVKTMEKPRDLQVGPEVTQYTALAGEMEKTADSLLMVRPDYTIYDEVRTTDDFEVFADMRLAGVGMIGVVHATRGIDALQRLIGRVELGLIPQVVDTVVYIEAGEVETVYDVTTEVKVPQGLTEEDLARPVILVRDFETGTPTHEIYTFNRQVVTVPLDGENQADSGVDELATREIERELERLAHGPVEAEVTSPNAAIAYVPEDEISAVIGKGGGQISEVEDRLGVNIDVRTHAERPGPDGGDGDGGSTTHGGDGRVVQPEVTGSHVVIPVDQADSGDTVEVRADGEYLCTATVGRGGEIQVSRGSAIADELERALDRQRTITVVRN